MITKLERVSQKLNHADLRLGSVSGLRSPGFRTPCGAATPQQWICNMFNKNSPRPQDRSTRPEVDLVTGHHVQCVGRLELVLQ
ncbi:hypothetical protein [Nocardia sp. NPDC004860]|uniref:hypothetical protein n=1 Tax=Nocardia sp. NPDC004860 TaxID=3154557 RepID=UPI0033B627A5